MATTTDKKFHNTPPTKKGYKQCPHCKKYVGNRITTCTNPDCGQKIDPKDPTKGSGTTQRQRSAGSTHERTLEEMVAESLQKIEDAGGMGVLTLAIQQAKDANEALKAVGGLEKAEGLVAGIEKARELFAGANKQEQSRKGSGKKSGKS